MPYYHLKPVLGLNNFIINYSRVFIAFIYLFFPTFQQVYTLSWSQDDVGKNRYSMIMDQTVPTDRKAENSINHVHSESATNPKTVNVQLETVLEFNDKDKDADVKFIGNIQKILKKVKIALSPETGRRSLSNNYNNNAKHIPFTDFILAAVDILLSYDDDDLENTFSILDDEIRKYHYKGCKFYELVEDENIRKFVARNLENLKKKKAKTLRKKLYKLVNIIGNAKLIASHKKFLDYINSLYRYESSKTFMNILQNLENYSYKSKRSNMNLIEITRFGIRSVLFDYFSKLNPNVRKDIKKNIGKTWSHKKKSKEKQTNEFNENDFVDIIVDETQTYNSKEDKKEASSSVSSELKSDAKINIRNAKDAIAGKNNQHATIRYTIKKKQSFLNQRPANKTIKQIDQQFTTKELKVEPLRKKHSAKVTDKHQDDFFIPIENTDLKPHSFERKEGKEKKKRNKQNKIKAKLDTTKSVEDNVRVGKKRKKNKKHKLKANEAMKENVEDTVIVKEETRNNLRSESSMTRPKKGSQENILINFENLAERRYSDKYLETKAPPRKRKKPIKSKQFQKPTSTLNIHSLSDEGMSIEYGNYRRIITSDKESETDKENDKERHKASAEIIRKHFINRINNLEKQMEEIVRKIDDPPTYNNVHEIKKKSESSTLTSNKDKLNITVKSITIKGTTQSYRILIGPEYIPYKNNISNKTPSTERKINSSNITDNEKTNISDMHKTTVSEDLLYLTDFDYSEAGIMKKLNISLKLPEEKSKSNDRHIEEKLKKPDEDKIKKTEIVEHRIELPLDNDNEIIQNNKIDESEINKKN